MPHIHSYILLVEIEVGTDDQLLHVAGDKLDDLLATPLSERSRWPGDWRRVRAINVGELAACTEQFRDTDRAAGFIAARCMEWHATRGIGKIGWQLSRLFIQ